MDTKVKSNKYSLKKIWLCSEAQHIHEYTQIILIFIDYRFSKVNSKFDSCVNSLLQENVCLVLPLRGEVELNKGHGLTFTDFPVERQTEGTF